MKILFIFLVLLILERCTCFLALLHSPCVSLTRLADSLFDENNIGEVGNFIQSIEKTVRQMTDDNDIQSEKTPSEKFILIYEVTNVIKYCFLIFMLLLQ